jgi:hypothetical protein
MFDDYALLRAFCELHARDYLAFVKQILERSKIE